MLYESRAKNDRVECRVSVVKYMVCMYASCIILIQIVRDLFVDIKERQKQKRKPPVGTDCYTLLNLYLLSTSFYLI